MRAVLELIGIVGSLRRQSVNAAIARAAAEQVVDGVTLEIVDIADIPLFNADVEAEGAPQSVVALQQRVGTVDGLIFFTPEYNGSLPAVTKNVIDWLSRPPKALENTPIAGVSATPGRRAGAGVLGHFDAILDHMKGDYVKFEMLGIGSYGDKFENLELVDPDARAGMADFLARFADFVRARALLEQAS